MQIDVHGMTAEKAKVYLRQNLHEFYLRGYPEAIIIHGNGSGTLKKEVRALLRGIPYVKSQRPGRQNEGGDGVTIISM